ncbi:MAG: hypothetical protein IIT46_03275, partial [Lachnospiraceae bacterium]|nr:hypothetical protein [Lachnospiraceae bacterium]
EIFIKMIKKYEYTITDEAVTTVKIIIESLERNKSDNFANARDVRNYFEQIITRQATRIATINSVCSMIKQFQSVHYPDFSTRISDKKLQTK